MIRSISRFSLCAAVLLACVADAQVSRKVELRKLTGDDLKVLTLRARHGEARSMTILGIAFVEGYGVSPDTNAGVHWLQKAAKSDDIAQEFLGTMLRNGRGVPPDIAAARGLFAKAAAQGNRKAQFNYASLCFNGEGGPQDVDAAAKYFEIAARQGDPEAQHMIGRMYQYGRGVVQDFDQAKRWYEAAAKQNYVPSIFALGLSYAEGDMGVYDLGMARKYLERAASMGNWAAANRMALLNMGEDGAEKNESEAYKWFAIARELSGAESVPSTSSLARDLKPVELSSAKEQVTQWKAQYMGVK